MARIATLLLVFYFLYVIGKATATATITTTEPSAGSVSFLEKWCTFTSYPTVCVQSLLPYANKIHGSPQQMALVALSVSLSWTKSAERYVLKLKQLKDLKPKKEYQPTEDCWELMSTSVDQIKQSVQELQHTGEAKDKDFSWHISNVQTWVSAALTDDTTCLDGFADKAFDGKVKDSIRARVVDVAQVTSNALALVNQFAKTH
ncbi:21 kDa protein-like [Melia azedarach]|uniref:21 kDa protein-like n=1 Tax=Melia azedarach TaxID=155640 RepID=A0ACC1X7P5_MELAZ|nr:21 kDa protein-like [Melia azedarach]